MNTASLLQTVPLFAGLDAEGHAALLAAGEERAAAAGSQLFQQGEAGDVCLVLLSGRVRLHRGSGSEELELAQIGPGAFFGEMALFDNSLRSATATVVEDARLFVLGCEMFLTLLSGNRQALAVVLARLAGNLRGSDAHRLDLLHQQQLLRAESEVARLRSVSQMVAGVAHEVNTPLGIIVNAASLMAELLPEARSGQDEAYDDLVIASTLILKNAHHAASLVHNFRNLSVRQITHAREVLPLAALVQEVLGLFAIEARKLKLTVNFESQLPPDDAIWDGIPGHLTQVLLNLLSNAGRYAYPAGSGGLVEVRLAAAEDGQFVLTVRDFGAGIAQANLARIFDPFFTTGRARDGVGLGLAIVYETVTAGLGGRITVTSTPGEGAVFVLHLPQQVPLQELS